MIGETVKDKKLKRGQNHFLKTQILLQLYIRLPIFEYLFMGTGKYP